MTLIAERPPPVGGGGHSRNVIFVTSRDEVSALRFGSLPSRRLYRCDCFRVATPGMRVTVTFGAARQRLRLKTVLGLPVLLAAPVISQMR